MATYTVFSTAGSFTWTAPANVTSVTVRCWGGGGAGGGSGGAAGGRGGGGAGGQFVNSVNLSVTPGTGYTVNVAAGGTGVSNANGNAGGDSWFNTTGTVIAQGGDGGKVGNGGDGAATNGNTTGAIGNTDEFAGGNGAAGTGVVTNRGGGGGGGAGTGGAGGNASTFTGGTGTARAGGSGGTGPNAQQAGAAGSVAGGAGSGSRTSALGSNQTGGAGAAGRVEVEWVIPVQQVAVSTSFSEPDIKLTIKGTQSVTADADVYNVFRPIPAELVAASVSFSEPDIKLTVDGTQLVSATTAANDADGGVGGSPSTGTATATANQGSVDADARPGLVSATGAANKPDPKLAPGAVGLVSATGVVNAPTVGTGGKAGTVAATVTAYAIEKINAGIRPELVPVTVAALKPDPKLTLSDVGLAIATGTVNGLIAGLGGKPQLVAVTGAAFKPDGGLGGKSELVAVTGTASTVDRVKAGIRPELVLASLTALKPDPRLTLGAVGLVSVAITAYKTDGALGGKPELVTSVANVNTSGQIDIDEHAEDVAALGTAFKPDPAIGVRPEEIG